VSDPGDPRSGSRGQLRFVRRRPPKLIGSRAAQFDLVRSVSRDARMERLSLSARHALVVAAQEWANADGWFYVKIATWAAKARVSPRTIHRAISAAKAEGLLVVEPYLRPDAAGQGASNYRFDPVLVRPGRAPAVTAARADNGSHPTGGDTSVRAQRSSNEKQNTPLIGKSTPLIMEECMRCASYGPCRDDGCLVLCESCRQCGHSREGRPG
jgi:hypothetical protein